MTFRLNVNDTFAVRGTTTLTLDCSTSKLVHWLRVNWAIFCAREHGWCVTHRQTDRWRDRVQCIMHHHRGRTTNNSCNISNCCLITEQKLVCSLCILATPFNTSYKYAEAFRFFTSYEMTRTAVTDSCIGDFELSQDVQRHVVLCQWVDNKVPVSYTHLTLPTIYSV